MSTPHDVSSPMIKRGRGRPPKCPQQLNATTPAMRQQSLYLGGGPTKCTRREDDDDGDDDDTNASGDESDDVLDEFVNNGELIPSLNQLLPVPA